MKQWWKVLRNCKKNILFQSGFGGFLNSSWSQSLVDIVHSQKATNTIFQRTWFPFGVVKQIVEYLIFFLVFIGHFIGIESNWLPFRNTGFYVLYLTMLFVKQYFLSSVTFTTKLFWESSGICAEVKRLDLESDPASSW